MEISGLRELRKQSHKYPRRCVGVHKKYFWLSIELCFKEINASRRAEKVWRLFDNNEFDSVLVGLANNIVDEARKFVKSSSKYLSEKFPLSVLVKNIKKYYDCTPVDVNTLKRRLISII